MSIIDREPGSPSPCDPGHRSLGAISVANLYVQGGMSLQYVAWLALGLAAYDVVFATVLPLTDKLVAVSEGQRPLDGWPQDQGPISLGPLAAGNLIFPPRILKVACGTSGGAGSDVRAGGILLAQGVGGRLRGS